MLSEAPPSREAVTTSRTWRDSVEVKTLTSSGMIAPARVPQVMIVESFHHIDVSPPRLGMSRYETAYVTPTERIEVIQTSEVRGASKFMLSTSRYFAEAMAALIQYENAEVMIISTRMTKIQTRSWVCTSGLAHGQQDEGDQRHAGDAVGLEAVGRRADRVAGVVAGAVGDDAGVARVVFLDVEDDLHQVGADVGDLGEDAAGDAQGRGAQRLADGEADEAGAGVVARHEQQDEEHQHQLGGDEQHADRHAGLERDVVRGERLAPQRGERRARVGEGVDADAEPGHAVAAGDADQAEERMMIAVRDAVVPQHAEVEDHDDADEDFQQQDELALGLQVGLAGLVDQLRDLAHRAMHGQVLELDVHDEAEEQPEDADDQAAHQQGAAVHAEERDAAEVRQHEIGLSLRLGVLTVLGRYRLHRRRRPSASPGPACA